MPIDPAALARLKALADKLQGECPPFDWLATAPPLHREGMLEIIERHSALRAAIALIERVMWRPIAEAPRDGTAILGLWQVKGATPDIDAIWWNEDARVDVRSAIGAWQSVCECLGCYRWQPGYTHFMPLPAPPKEKP